VSKHEEFPKLTPETQAAYRAGCLAAFRNCTNPLLINRRFLAAFLREAMDQAWGNCGDDRWWDDLLAIANNLHSPPPTPPTLAQARAADLDTQEGIETVRAFLATLGQGGQL